MYLLSRNFDSLSVAVRLGNRSLGSSQIYILNSSTNIIIISKKNYTSKNKKRIRKFWAQGKILFLVVEMPEIKVKEILPVNVILVEKKKKILGIG